MSKHIEYAKTFGVFYDAYRHFLRELNDENSLVSPQEQFREWYLKNFTYSLDDATCSELFIRDLNHELYHIYVPEPALIDFFKKMEIRDIEGIKQYIRDNGENVVVNKNDECSELEEGINFAFCVHPARMKQGYVFGYTLYVEQNELRIFINHGMEQYHISSTEIEKKNSVVYTDQEINEMTKFAINLIAYINAFPECLTEGVPHGVKTENNHYLKASEKVIDALEKNEKGVVSPHFRRGYFKRLSSDFYKNKKGQIVFVHETIVNGKAKTLDIN